MKPSEIGQRVYGLEDQAISYENSAAEFDALAKAKRGLAANTRALHRRMLDAIDAEVPWDEIEAQLDLASREPTIEVTPEEPPKPTRKPRADKGVPRGSKGNAREGRNSPLTTERKGILVSLLQDEPMTLTGLFVACPSDKITATSGEAELESWLCEDPQTFIRWVGKRDDDPEPVELWGLWEQFLTAYKASGQWQGRKDNTHDLARVIEFMGCSVEHARRAILEALKT